MNIASIEPLASRRTGGASVVANQDARMWISGLDHAFGRDRIGHDTPLARI
jgi:hypothetical protein